MPCFRSGTGRLFRTLGLIALSALAPTAWGLSGTLLDNSGNALEGASVKLMVANKSATTNADGYFTLEASTGLRDRSASALQTSKPILYGNAIRFTAGNTGTARVAIHSIDGRLANSFQIQVAQGYHVLPLDAGDRVLPRGMYFVAFELDGVRSTFRYFRASSSIPASLPGAIAHARSAALRTASLPAVDTLVVTKTNGEVKSTRKILVHAYDDSINTYLASGKQILILDPSNDNDDDGLTNYEERYQYFTNAELADTDGDGVSDKTEITDSRSPLVADIPSIAFEPLEYPSVVANFSKSVGSSKTRDISTGGEISNSSTFSSQQQVNVSAEIAYMQGAEGSFGTDMSATVKGEVTVTAGFGFSQTWTNEQSQSMSRNWSEAISLANSVDATISGGRIAMRVRFTNKSGNDLTLVDPQVALSLRGFQSSTLGTRIGNLTIETGSKELYVSSEPGHDTASAIFSTTTNNADLIEEFANVSTCIVGQLTNIQFKVSGGAIDTMMSNVYRRTAQVIVDPGSYSSNPMTRKRVAKKNLYNEFYTSQFDRYVGNTLDGVLKAGGVTPVLDSTAGKFGISSIGGLKNGAFNKGSWAVVIQKTSDSVSVYAPSIASYDPRRINVDTTSVVSVVYSADVDGDGLPGRLEAVLGTADTLKDTDADGISDRDEYAGWRRESDPADASWRTNPRSIDTDGDALIDSSDANPLMAALDPKDSAVSVTSIAITSPQAAAWNKAGPITDSTVTYSVNSQVRGPGKISIVLAHPALQVLIVRSGGTDSADTVKLFKSDNGTVSTYTANLPLTIGSNEILVTIHSKSGTARKKITLGAIQRRLARIPADAKYFVYNQAPVDARHNRIDVNVYMSKIKELDPLIDAVYLMRAKTMGVLLDATLATKIRSADDLGDSGNVGASDLAVGNTAIGKDGNLNSYIVDAIIKSDTTVLDTKLERLYDHALFLYTGNSRNAGRKYLTAPTATAQYVKPDRTVMVDSIILIDSCKRGWGVFLTDWETTTRVKVQIPSAPIDTTINQFRSGINNGSLNTVKLVFPAGAKLPEGGSIFFPRDGLGDQFTVNNIGTWTTVGTVKDTVVFHELVRPVAYPFTTGSYFVRGNFANAGHNIYTTTTLVNGLGEEMFRAEWSIHWHYQYGPTE